MLRIQNKKKRMTQTLAYPTQAMTDFYRYLESTAFVYWSYHPYRLHPQFQICPYYIDVEDEDELKRYQTIPFTSQHRLKVNTNFFVDQDRLGHFHMNERALHILETVVFQNEKFWLMFKTEHGHVHWISVFSMVCKSWKDNLPVPMMVRVLTKSKRQTLYSLSVRFGLTVPFIVNNIAPYATYLLDCFARKLKQDFAGKDLTVIPFQLNWSSDFIQSNMEWINSCLSYDIYNCYQFMEYKIKEDLNNLEIFKTKIENAQKARKSRLEKSKIKRDQQYAKKMQHAKKLDQILQDEGMSNLKGWHMKSVNESKVHYMDPIPIKEIRFLCYIERYCAAKFNAFKRQWSREHPKQPGATHFAETQLSQELRHLDFANTRFGDLPPP